MFEKIIKNWKFECFLMAFLLSTNINLSAQNKIVNNQNKKIRIGVLCKYDVEVRYKKGIQDAFDDFKKENKQFAECINIQDFMFTYRNELEGEIKLNNWIMKKEVEIILGPTDSGIFIRALKDREKLGEKKIPIISPTVTIPVGNQPDGWFFRTNVDIVSRIRTIYDFLHKYWIRSIGILYADTEFGRRAKDKLNVEIRKTKNHKSFLFTSNDSMRDGVGEILQWRPEALGVFGSCEDILKICNYLESMNASSSYKPFLFTIIDACKLSSKVDSFYFVSSAKSKPNEKNKEEVFNEVWALAYDTTVFVLSELKKLDEKLNKYDAIEFRNQFVALLNGPTEETGIKTGMKFGKLENTAELKVFRIMNNEIQRRDSLDVKWIEKVQNKLDLIKRRYGFWPEIYIILMIGIVITVNITDIKRWYGKGLRKEWKHPHLYIFIGLNLVLVMILYFFLAERGVISYGNIFQALGIALAPSILIKTTLFETSAGKAISLAKLYDKILEWINDRLMMSRYKSHSNNVNVLAYHNSESDLRSVLHQIYNNARIEAQRNKLRNDLEEELRGKTLVLERRRIYARRLLNRLDWEELEVRNLVPKQEKFSKKNPIDPEKIIRESVRYCSEDPKRLGQVKKAFDEYMKEVEQDSPESHEEIKKKWEEVTQDVSSERDRLFIQIRFLFVQFGFNPKSLEDKEMLTKDYEIQTEKKRSSRMWFIPRKNRADR